uniref:Putative conserved secreted protein n=1 Tax=Lutzomyia longipalpis TaxID=7200 RepID=A0A1B0CP02_LUTLO
MKILTLIFGSLAVASGIELSNDLWDEFRDREIFFYTLKSNGTSDVSLARARRPAEKNCICTTTQCDCCAGLKLPRLKVNRQICTKMNYNRHTSLLRMGLCVKLFDLSTPGPNLHMCMDWLARIASVPIIVLHFDCMQMGLDGVHFMKPGESIDMPEGGAGGTTGGAPGGPVDPTNQIIEPGSPVTPATPSPPAPAPLPPDTGIITSPSGPNLPQIGGDGSDFDPVDDIKKKPIYY